MRQIERTICIALIVVLASVCGFIFPTAPGRAQAEYRYKIASWSQAKALDCSSESGFCHEDGWILVGAVADSSGKPTALLFRSP